MMPTIERIDHVVMNTSDVQTPAACFLKVLGRGANRLARSSTSRSGSTSKSSTAADRLSRLGYVPGRGARHPGRYAS